MKWLSTLFVVGGFCLGTLGAAGFDVNAKDMDFGAVRDNAWGFFVGGLLLLIVGGVLMRMQRRRPEAGMSADSAPPIVAGMQAIREQVAAIDDEKSEANSEELRQRVVELLRNDFFDLTSRNEELIAQIGFTDYARVWEGIAGAERLLNRYWSLATDGHHEEALAELPLARAQMDQATESLMKVTSA